MNLIVYFHGLDSSKNSAKVDKLRNAFPNELVVCFDAPLDPYEAINVVSTQINNVLFENINSIEKMVFVGTSLGAWLAAELALEYGCTAILVNPPEQPAIVLKRLGKDPEIAHRYMDLCTDGKQTYIFSLKDDILDEDDFKYRLQKRGKDVYVVEGASHQFNGPEFDMVISMLKLKL